MKIGKIYIRELAQFQKVDFDFINPETGLPLEKVCFIGSNGTGKSKLLKLILWLYNDLIKNLRTHISLTIKPGKGKVLFQMFFDSEIYFVYHFKGKVNVFKFLHNDTFSSTDEFAEAILRHEDFRFINKEWLPFLQNNLSADFLSKFQFSNNRKDLVIYSPAESTVNAYKDIKDVPVTNVNEALSFSRELPYYYEVSSDKVNVFWKLLVFNLRKRAEERERFENIANNLTKTKLQLIEAFDAFYPKILENLGEVWNKILNKPGLFFDVKGASNPYQLTDNLKAYIKLKSNNEVIPYSELSTGIRNYIFRLGHIFSLYFNREIDRAILLVDEPENSLYPDFLFDLMETYNEIIIDKRGENNTQLFFSTHNPIVAAQFKPYERIVLSWKDDGSVEANKGISPEGDDPNDILKKDFGLHQLMSKVGISEWKNYLKLKGQLKEAQSTEEKMTIASEINKIGTAYNFPA